MGRFEIFNQYSNLVAGFSSISDGNMSPRFGDQKEVSDNLVKYFSSLNIESNKVVLAKLLHSDKIVEITAADINNGSREFECDALITKCQNVYLWFGTADCLPIFCYDPINKVVALVHCGWQSTDRRLAEKVILKMVRDFGCIAGELLVGIGPAIRKESYIFSDPQTKDREEWSKYLELLPSGEYKIDNVQYNIDQLIKAGIKPENIEDSFIDTGASTEYFSHYRSKRTADVDGRICNVIGIKFNE